MVITQPEKYHALLDQARAKAEDKFESVFVTGRKNVILLRRKSAKLNDNPFMTIKINFHDLSFHHGCYDMDFDVAVKNFQDRAAESYFNVEYDVPVD